MIYAFKNKVSSIDPKEFDTFSAYSVMRNLFVVDSSFYFEDVDDFNDITKWAENIVLNNITPVYNAKDSETNHVEALNITNQQGVEISIHKGKYRFILYFNYDIELYNKLLKLDNQPAYIYWNDINNNLYGKYEGNDIFGVRCELFSIQKLIFGSREEPSGMKLAITIHPKEVNGFIIKEASFTPDELRDYEFEEEQGYSITNVTRFTNDFNSVILRVVVRWDDETPVTDITGNRFIINDNLSGNIPFDVITESSPGVYDISVLDVVTSGVVYLDVYKTFNYNIISLQLTYSDTFTNFYNTTINGHQQRVPMGWTASAATNPIPKPDEAQQITESVDGHAVFKVLEGETAPYLTIQTNNNNVFRKNDHLYIRYKSNYTTIELPHPDTQLEFFRLFSSAIGEPFRLQEGEHLNTYHFTSGMGDWVSYLNINTGLFTGKAEDVIVEMLWIKIYREV